MESVAQVEGPATKRFREELRAFLPGPVGLQGPAIDKVSELTIGETKKITQKSNLDDLNDFAKHYLQTEAIHQ